MSYKRIEIEPITYVSHSDFISFVSKNSDMEWNDICNYVRDNILDVEKVFCRKNDYFDENQKKYHNPESWKWIRAFFETYPEFDEIMFIFDD